jgi:histidinol-phosphatase
MDDVVSPFLPVAIKAVKQAELVILNYYGQSSLRVRTKSDQTPVTEADKAAEEIIEETIHAEFPDHTFFGEEGEKADLNNHSGFTWIIDPIDGTKSFIRGFPLFGTLLALLHDGELIVGVSNAPAWGELICAAKGEGTFLNGKKVHVSTVGNLTDAYLSNGRLSYFEELGKVPQLLDVSRPAKWARGMGDFWMYHLVSEGKIDVMMEASVKFWDIAAAKVIIEEAGGKMTQLDGNPITYQSTTVLATNGLLHQKIVKAMA